MTEDEACVFLGFGFARIPSRCEYGSCSNIGLNADGQVHRNISAGIQISCAAAPAIARERLLPRGKNVRVDTSVEAMKEIVGDRLMASLELLAFGGAVSWERLSDLRRIDEWAWDQAVANWAYWRDVTFPAFRGSAFGTSFIKTTEAIVSQWEHVSMLSTARNHAIVEVIRFYFSLTSVARVGMLHDSTWMFLSDALREWPPVYRQHSAWREIASNSPDLVRVSEDIDRVSSPHEGESILEPMTRIALLMSQWTPSSSQALLEMQAIMSMCPRLTLLFTEADGQNVRSAQVIRVGVTLIDFCRRVVPFADLETSRAVLASVRHPGYDGVQVPASGSLTEAWWVHAPWAIGLGHRLSPLDRKAVATRILGATLMSAAWLLPIDDVPFQCIQFWDDTGSFAMALGRAIGIALLSGADLMSWRLEPSVARIMHKPGRLGISRLSEISMAARSSNPRIMAKFLEMVAGMDEVLDPGGHEMFTTSEWMRRFGPPETYY